jgi:hypothetical protein
MPHDVAARAEEACDRGREQVEVGAEPFGAVGRAWLARFLTELAGPVAS